MEAAKRAEAAAAEAARVEHDKKRAAVAAMNALADSDPAAYDAALQAMLAREAEAKAAGVTLSADGDALPPPRDGPEARREEAAAHAAAALTTAGLAHRPLQDLKRRLRARAALPFAVLEERPPR